MDVYVAIKFEGVALDNEEFEEELLRCIEGYFGSDIGSVIIEKVGDSDFEEE